MKRTLVLVALALTAALTVAGCGNDTTNDPATGTQSTHPGDASGETSSLDGTSMPPWPAPVDDVPARVAAAGLDLGPMGTAEHYHLHLRILVNGTEVSVPPNIGVDPATGAMSAVHTHEADGTIHIEAVTAGEVLTLGQLFTEWGVKLTSTQVGGASTEPGQQVEVTSNGTADTGDPNDLRLEPDQQIVLQIR
ncbi:MAG: hypothetical protein H0U51_05800 [Propionibacteriales bacterium]|jgi:hypothetical protein|nr:hypothetical protein [Propionibacteriales bacterium]